MIVQILLAYYTKFRLDGVINLLGILFSDERTIKQIKIYLEEQPENVSNLKKNGEYR